MNNTQERHKNYTPHFEAAIIKIFLDVSLSNSSEKAYCAIARKNDDGVKLDVSFQINTEEKSSDEVAERLSRFIDFVVDQNLEGVKFNDKTSTLTFDDAGYVVAAIQEYIIKNPDFLDQQTLNDLEEKIFKVYENHYVEPEGFENNIYDKLTYPQTAKAVSGGFQSVIGWKDLNDSFGMVYQEGKGEEHLIRLVCNQIEGHQGPDAQYIAQLKDLYDEISVLASDKIDVRLSGEHDHMLEIHSPHPLETLNLLKSLYRENDIIGIEDSLAAHADGRIARNRLGDMYDKVFSKEEEKLFPEASRKFKRDMLSHVHEQLASYGQDNLDNLGMDRQLSIVPMSHFTSLKNMAAQTAFNLHSRGCVSMKIIEGLIRTEVGQVTDITQRAYRFH